MKTTFIFLSLALSYSTLAGARAIYGEDNRHDTVLTRNALFDRLARSSAALIDQDKIRYSGNTAELMGPSLGSAYKLCSDQRFADQPFIATCSGTLVAPDIIATAGHCFESRDRCSRFKWVFNYKLAHEFDTSVSVSRNDVYGCKEVIKQGLKERGMDFALIRLDRRVQGVTPVPFTRSPVEVGTPVVMIGHPSGLPQKIADGAEVRSVGLDEFKANVDAFQINSGSGVFSAESGELLGVLVRGIADYRGRPGKSCNEVQRVSNDQPGEDISNWSQFTKYLN